MGYSSSEASPVCQGRHARVVLVATMNEVVAQTEPIEKAATKVPSGFFVPPKVNVVIAFATLLWSDEQRELDGH